VDRGDYSGRSESSLQGTADPRWKTSHQSQALKYGRICRIFNGKSGQYLLIVIVSILEAATSTLSPNRAHSSLTVAVSMAVVSVLYNIDLKVDGAAILVLVAAESKYGLTGPA